MLPAPEAPAADLVYSLALGAAMVGVVAAWGLWVTARRDGRARRWCRWVAALATTSFLVSLAVHLAFGHPPGSARALGPRGFAGEHPALMLAGGLALGALWLSRGGGAGRGRR